MDKRELRVFYDGPADFEMEKMLTELIKKFGWRWRAQGLDHTTGKRFIAFVREAE